MLHWVFCRNRQAITCEVDARGAHTFDVCVIPHWSVADSVVERFDTAAHAFERHAELALELAGAGWVHTDGEWRHSAAA